MGRWSFYSDGYAGSWNIEKYCLEKSLKAKTVLNPTQVKEEEEMC